ncbi:Gfo/Idh/MocA family oxidoreductase [Paenibacillus sacheonensis]|uniref:Inositol 2-dehydrogenase/D-chiro-inositol 3-dehydrogenase n=1 Tax=Paenibacillus sacheonensis TaxID=742054 RepID=A0A7X5C1L5_9BACL|nr:Gfo/Idh/MocA family oxidoreductase [Paenibacillus sacheonensis]MBM7566202.1 myo-inositol 2-dehydrogenase/D-chiro-inositol 1-dehydrogenase [Paenibacillus sacheonensis]NBC70410.1 Gfo/Idh/MocA family oxidoreductase [Paenibacillus sacheonensis]
MTLRVGVIGTGAIGREHVRRMTQVLKGAEVVAVTDVNAAQAREVVDAFKLQAVIYENGQELIRAQDVDAVMVTSWGATHEEFVLASIAAGKPVFCEKPLAVTAEGCKAIVEAESAFGKRLVQVGYMRRYDRGYRAVKEALVNGTIGEPLILNCAHRNVSVPDFYTRDMSIVDTFIHELDVHRWLLDDDYVSVQVVQPRKSRLAGSHLQDPLLVYMETAKGVRINGEIFVNCKYGYDIQCQVVGEMGIVSLPEPMSVTMRSEAKLSTGLLTDWKERFIEAYDIELQDWIDSTLRGEMNGPSAWDGYAAAIASDACLEARDSGAIVRISMPERPSFYRHPSEDKAASGIS